MKTFYNRNFFKESLLEETEKIEHVLNKETLECIMKFIDKMEQDKT